MSWGDCVSESYTASSGWAVSLSIHRDLPRFLQVSLGRQGVSDNGRGNKLAGRAKHPTHNWESLAGSGGLLCV